MSKLTLEQVRDEIAYHIGEGKTPTFPVLRLWLGKISASLKAQDEPVAWMHDTKGEEL